MSSVVGHNPMFPERALPDVDIDVGKKTSKGGAGEDDDFLSRHGGKVALVGFGLAAWLIYRWFRNNSNRNETESHMRMEYALSPSEINEMRHRNAITSDQYRGLIKAALSEFRSAGAITASPKDSQSPALSSRGAGDLSYGGALVSYRDFIAFVKRYLHVDKLTNGHHLDRVVLKYVESNRNYSASLASATHPDTASTTASVPDELDDSPPPDDEVPVPLPFLLVAFSMTVAARQAVRFGDMFFLCQELDATIGSSATSSSSTDTSSTNNSSASDSDVLSTSTSSGYYDIGRCSRAAFLLTLQYLTDSCQVRMDIRCIPHLFVPCISTLIIILYVIL
jgi:hypothetical protein